MCRSDRREHHFVPESPVASGYLALSVTTHGEGLVRKILHRRRGVERKRRVVDLFIRRSGILECPGTLLVRIRGLRSTLPWGRRLVFTV